MANAREAAMKILMDVTKNGAYVNLALSRGLESTALEEADRGFVTQLAYGTVENLSAIDGVISSLSKIKMKKISPPILAILRLGVYQILYLDKVPKSAAVNEAVKLARRYGHAASAGFVNALLRAAAKGAEGAAGGSAEIAAAKGGAKAGLGDAVADAAGRFSYPLWLAKRWEDEFGADFALSLMAPQGAPEIFIRVNPLKTTPEALLQQIKAEKTDTEGVLVYKDGPISKSEAFAGGLFSVQDKAFGHVARAVGPKPGQRVLDACAAPGGKTCHLAELMQNQGEIVAFDVHEHKIKLIQENARRLGITIVKALCQDASVFVPELEEGFDAVLLDVPCSGLGVIRRRPDLKQNRAPEDFESLNAAQRSILEACWRYVKPGGVLVYATCTFEKCENGDMVRWFIEKHPAFTIVEEKQFFPHIDHTDGMYYCKMIRNN